MEDAAPTPQADSPDIEVGDKPREYRVFDHGFVRLDDCMASDLSVVNSARVSFAVRREVMEEKDRGLIRFLMRERHGTPFEHNSFRFHIRTPIFVAREWFRHRVGCLTEDTVVTFVNIKGVASSNVRKTMGELWDLWSTPATASVQSRVRDMHLRVLNETTEEFELGHIADVIEKGIQPVYKVALSDGKHLTATLNHQVLTSDGWKLLGEAVGVEGSPEHPVMTNKCRLMVNGKLSYANTLRRLTAHPVEVISIAYVGMRRTFDLTVAGEWHNFVANGIVVHNSFNEESARYHQLEGDFYVPSPTAVRTQVGKPGAYSFEAVEQGIADETIDTFKKTYELLYNEYMAMIEKGVAKELARAILPFGIYTQFYWTLNARSLMNFLSLRNAEAAQYEIRTYAEAVERLFAAEMPITHACFVEFDRKTP
jgi:thymidylate synthase ThyX